MKHNFTIYDIIDFEFFLDRYEKLDPRKQKKKNLDYRKLYLEKTSSGLIDTDSNHKDQTALKMWLIHNRNLYSQNKQQDLPGETVKKTYILSICLTIIFSLLTGISASGGFLAYSGNTPVNVSLFFITFVIFQIFLIIFPFLSLLFYNKTDFFRNISFLQQTVQHLIFYISDRVKRVLPSTITKESLNSQDSLFSIIKSRIRLYDSCFYWPFFQITQIFGIFFNIGVIGFTLIKVVSSDLAFGWQSTIVFSHETILRIVKTIALPWRLFIKNNLAYPDLEQIEGSRIILKEGIEKLATQDLISWWPFLCLSLTFYVLLPRILLYTAGLFRQKHSLSNVTFHSVSARKLLITMLTEHVEIKPQTESSVKRIQPSDFSDIERSALRMKASRNTLAENSIFLVSNEILNQLDQDVILLALEKKSRIKPRLCTGITMDFDDDLPTFRKDDTLKEADNVFILLEGWMPPIRETMLYVMDLRHYFSNTTCFFILLTGRNETLQSLEDIDELNLKLWKQETGSLNDPGITVESIF